MIKAIKKLTTVTKVLSITGYLSIKYIMKRIGEIIKINKRNIILAYFLTSPFVGWYALTMICHAIETRLTIMAMIISFNSITAKFFLNDLI
jgi:hypothetical protein